MAKEYAKWRIRLVDVEADRELRTVRDIFSATRSPRASLGMPGRGMVPTSIDPDSIRSAKSEVTVSGPAGCTSIIGGAGVRRPDIQRVSGSHLSGADHLDRPTRKGCGDPGQARPTGGIGTRRSLYQRRCRRSERASASLRRSAAAIRQDRWRRSRRDGRFRIGAWPRWMRRNSRPRFQPRSMSACASPKCLRTKPLDFVLFFSSLVSFIKNPLQSHYASGCTFKDAFAGQLARTWSSRRQDNELGLLGTTAFTPEQAQGMCSDRLGLHRSGDCDAGPGKLARRSDKSNRAHEYDKASTGGGSKSERMDVGLSGQDLLRCAKAAAPEQTAR